MTKSAIIFCLSFFLLIPAFGQVYPPPACVLYDEGSLLICPPDSVPGYSGGLLSYTIYMDEEFLASVSAGNPADTATYVFDPLPLPGYREFCAKAVYLNWISDATCETVFVHYGFELPFFEDWSSGSFETNQWIQEGDYWSINNDLGKPSPSAAFHPTTTLTDYFIPLTSYCFESDTQALKFILVEFDIKLESIDNSGKEHLNLQYWHWNSQTWQNTNCGVFYNGNGSFDWKHTICKFPFLNDGPLTIRFSALGENSDCISGWFIDNIEVYQDCGSIYDLTSTINEEDDVVLEWEMITDCFDCYWCWVGYYHPQDLYSVFIGPDSEADFDVAHVWTTEILDQYEGMSITAVEFYPGEALATYSIRIWEGDSAVLVYEQAVEDPVIMQWNEVFLDTIHLIDITQKLWIGYHIDNSTGYPAGADDGPAYEGRGNMIYFEGKWSTLTEITSGQLDVNWLINAYPGEDYPEHCANKIYKKVGDGDFELIGQVPADYYFRYFVDEQVDLSQTNCYQVTNVNVQYRDTCESEHYGESCVLPVSIKESISEEALRIYPNPAEDLLYLHSSFQIDEIQMIDVTGRMVFNDSDQDKEIIIDVSYLSAGIYLLKVIFNDGQLSRKVLIR